MSKKSFGTAPVFLTAISTILGAILFLRFGYAVGTVGFVGVLLIIFLGHLVTIPTALALSEIATNQKVEGGGEYFIVSRSFGLNIGATVGISLYFSQAISVAFYVIAFTEAFSFVFQWAGEYLGIMLPRQVISLPAMLLLGIVILTRGASMGVKMLYIVVSLLVISLTLFFLGKTDYQVTHETSLFSISRDRLSDFFLVFAIIFPGFTGMTAGVGLSGDLKNPGKSIPLGTILATFIGMITYIFIIWKLAVSASPEDLRGEQLIMAKIALGGKFIIPVGLAASTISSAIGSILVAPRTLQALAGDNSLPTAGMNRFLSRGKGPTNEPFNATLITSLIAIVFVALGSVDAVARIISMFFMVTYGSLCLISFLYHFGSDPAYRPTFRSRWYFSLSGFIMCFFLMFLMNPFYAFLAIVLMILLYIYIAHKHKERAGIQIIFENALFQINRNLSIYIQKSKRADISSRWRPSIVSVSSDSFLRQNAIRFLDWVAEKYGFATYIHLIQGYYSRKMQEEAAQTLDQLIKLTHSRESNVYVDTLISPSYTSAIAQIVQLPGISGMENNMVVFEFDKSNATNLEQIVDNFALATAANLDVCILGSSDREINYEQGIHIWIKSTDVYNANLMILIGYIISGHKDWKSGEIKIIEICQAGKEKETREALLETIRNGRLPVAEHNIQLIPIRENKAPRQLILQHSRDAGLVMIGFHTDQIKHRGKDIFLGYEDMGEVAFVNARDKKEIS